MCKANNKAQETTEFPRYRAIPLFFIPLSQICLLICLFLFRKIAYGLRIFHMVIHKGHILIFCFHMRGAFVVSFMRLIFQLNHLRPGSMRVLMMLHTIIRIVLGSGNSFIIMDNEKP